jgi:hypothetical protein
LKECVEKHWLIDYIQIFQSYEFQSALTLPSPSSESRSFFSFNLLGEGGKFYTETKRWGGELKG